MTNDPASLQNLNGIVAPGPVPWWPPAPGWFVLLILLAVLAAWGGIRLYRWWRANAYRREALRQFYRLQAEGDGRAQELPGLLKRTALSAWPREQVASLSGTDWHRFLDRTASANLFSSGAGQLLDRLAYPESGVPELSAEEYRQLSEVVAFWLKKHRAEAA